MRSIIKGIGFGTLCILAGSCLMKSDDDGTFDIAPIYDIAYIDILESDSSGWIGGVSDYPDSLYDKLNFQTSYMPLNGVFASGNNRVFRISANNPHGDLFYFMAKKFEGFNPNSKYKIAMTFEVQAAIITDTVGNFPLDIYFKMGAGSIEPSSIRLQDSEYYGFNLSKGDNESVGSAFMYLMRPYENIGKTSPVIIRFSDNSRNKIFETNDKGELWIILGIDSKLPLEQAYSFNTIAVFFKQVLPV